MDLEKEKRGGERKRQRHSQQSIRKGPKNRDVAHEASIDHTVVVTAEE